MTGLRVVVALLGLTIAAGVTAAPSAELWERWTAHDESSEATIDHSAWTDWLSDYRVMGDNGVARVNYGAVSEADAKRLQAYLDTLAGTKISQYNRDVQQAYWNNLYNAQTVAVILEHYPVDSIIDIDISPGLFSSGPWGKKVVQVEGEDLSFDDIEHRILRPIWQDPRIHYAANCAAIGCPNLQAEAFTAANTQELLDGGAKAYVNHPRGAAFDGDQLMVSSIYEWFQADFGGDEAGVIAHLRKYAQPELAKRLEGRDGYDADRYDWSLNDVSGT